MTNKTAKYLAVSAGVRYWEDGEVDGVEDTDGDLMPFGGDKYWDIKIDIETGFIIDWPNGITAKVHYKVCDDGAYSLLAEDGEVIDLYEGYVLSCLSRLEAGYGDYIIMDIDGLGHIKGWDKHRCLEDFSRDND